MAVGIEDASMLYGMLTGRIPPIANHQENDLELGNLNYLRAEIIQIWNTV